MRVKEKNSDIITVRSVLNHVRSKRVCVFYSLLFLALLEVREADASHRSHRNVARANSSFLSARNARAGGFGGGFRAVVFECCQKIDESPSVVQTFKFGLDRRRRSVDSFFSSPPLASFFDFDDDDPSHSNADDAFSFLSPAQVLLWSVVLVPGDANSVWNVSAQQYYQRETGNLKSFQRQPRFQFQVKVLDLYLESLAHKQEHLWRKEEFNLYDKNLQPSHPEPPDKRTGIGLSLSSLGRCLFEEVVSSKFSKSTAIGERINNYNLNVRV